MKNGNERKKHGVYRFKIKNGSDPGLVSFPKDQGEVEESDINLMMIFGMEKEARFKNPEKYNKVKMESESNSATGGKQEYLSKKQNGEFNREFKKRHSAVRIKMIVAFLLFICCTVFELVVFRNETVQEVLLNYSPIIVVLFAIQLLLLCIAVGYRQYFAGFGFSSGKYVAGGVFTVLSTACLAYYTLLSVMLAMGKAVDIVEIKSFYLTAVSFCLILSTFEELNHVKREWKSFLAVSEGRGCIHTLDKNPEDGGRRFSDADKKRSLAVKKTKFISGFVSRNEKGITKRSGQNALVAISLLVSVGFAIYRYVTVREVLSSASVLLTSLVLTLPFSSFLTFSLGFKNAVDNAYKKGCGVVGLRTFEQMQSVSSVYFDDVAVFPPAGVKLKGFKSYGNSRIDRSLYIISSIYKKIDGPAASMFIKAVGNGEQSDKVDIIDVSANGIHAIVDGNSVYMGGVSYMSECGFKLPEKLDEELSPGICVMYMAVSGDIAMKMYIEYAIDKKMVQTIESLRKYGIYLGIFTCDPNINDVMMNKLMPLEKYPVGIQRSLEGKGVGKISDSVSSGIMSNKGTGSLLSTLLICINTLHSIKTDMILKFFSLAAGVLISFVITVFSVEGHISSWFFILYQMFWLIPSYLIGKIGPRS